MVRFFVIMFAQLFMFSVTGRHLAPVPTSSRILDCFAIGTARCTTTFSLRRSFGDQAVGAPKVAVEHEKLDS